MMSDRVLVLLVLMLGIAAMSALAAVLIWREALARDMEARMTEVVSRWDARRDAGSQQWYSGLLRGVRRIGLEIGKSRVFSQKDIRELEQAISAAGYNPRELVPMLIGAKILAMVMIPASTYLICLLRGAAESRLLIYVVLSIPIGMLLPDWVIQFLRRPYVRAIKNGIPDALDLLVVCTEAGMGFESAVERVANEIGASNPAMAVELSILSHELKVLPERGEALRNFGERSGVEALKRLSTILVQTLKYGTPLGQSLRSIAAELRRERTVKLEEKAAKLPAMLVMPLILFIMPSLFIILIGSSILRLIDALTSFLR
jgi:tight adherence protein C